LAIWARKKTFITAKDESSYIIDPKISIIIFWIICLLTILVNSPESGRMLIHYRPII
jgi:hypothetical protein